MKIRNIGSKIPPRNQQGSGVTVICALLALYVLPVIGLFAFDAGRTVLAQQKLKNAIDSAALTAAATLAAEDSRDLRQSHDRAADAALDMMKRNFVFNVPLVKTTSVGQLTSAPAMNNCEIQVDFVDPKTQAVVPRGDVRAERIKVSGRFTTQTAFGKLWGCQKLTVAAASVTALPKVDLVICVDVSNSMDDQTPISLVKRYWDPTAKKIIYQLAVGSNGQPGQGSESSITNAATLGSALVAVPPQHLTGAYFDNKFLFSEFIAQQASVPNLRSKSYQTEVGGPPGNYPNALPDELEGAEVFSDLVVNLDGKDSFNGCNIDGYNFPDLGTLVEAARGNLENQSVFVSSKANTSIKVAPKPGYQQKYFELVRKNMQPLREVQGALSNLMELMSRNADAHFSFVSFASQASRLGNTTETHGVLDEMPPYGSGYGANKAFTLPFVPLSRNQENLQEALAALNQTVPLSGTNIGDAIESGVQLLTGSESRRGAVKAIVLITDGIPTVAPGVSETSGPPPYGRPNAYARSAAVKAHDNGIPIFCIGLAQNTKLKPFQLEILNDTNSDPGSGGVAGIAGNGGLFVPVEDASEIEAAFRYVMRDLVRLVYAPDAK